MVIISIMITIFMVVNAWGDEGPLGRSHALRLEGESSCGEELPVCLPVHPRSNGSQSQLSKALVAAGLLLRNVM